MTISHRATAAAVLVLVAGYSKSNRNGEVPRQIPGVLALANPSTTTRSMWKLLEDSGTQQSSLSPSAHAWKTIFGQKGERGEYMDGYSPEAMIERCVEDYHWERETKTEPGTEPSPSDLDAANHSLASRRAAMMAHLYDNDELWKHTSMVAFAEHYVVTGEHSESCTFSKPYETFRKQRALRPEDEPIFAGVVWEDWERQPCVDDHGLLQTRSPKPAVFAEHGIDYVRLHCNCGDGEALSDPSQLLGGDERIRTLLGRLAGAARECQQHGMVPLVLLQVPWRHPERPAGGSTSTEFLENAVRALTKALVAEGVDCGKLLFETRPPIGVSAADEGAMASSERWALGLNTGRTVFRILDQAFGTGGAGQTPAGFCVAGGSTKGAVPTAMQDDTQAAVRRGIRERALAEWGYEACFWEMGAKLMLQPAVGRLWGTGDRGASSELFRSNAKALAEELVELDGL